MRKMTTRLNVRINPDCHLVLDRALFEKHITPEKVLEVGVMVLGLLENAEEAYLIAPDGSRQELSTRLTPGMIYLDGTPHDLADFNSAARLLRSTAELEP